MKRKKWIYPLIFLGLMFASSCKKEDNAKVPVLTTAEVIDITQNTATCGGTITSDGGSSISSKGVCWTTGLTPTISDSKTNEGKDTGCFTSKLTGLSPDTKYYVKAYATNKAGTGYGSAMSFETNVIDADSNVYHRVKIGNQVWIIENLKVTHYRNGDAIPNVTDNTVWRNLSTGAYRWYNNDVANKDVYGALYNWYTVIDNRSLCPTGWHVPTDAEWRQLINFLGGENVAGGKLKETGTTHWISPNTGATNESGFTALPGGYCIFSGSFYSIGAEGYWWSSTEQSATSAANRRMSYYFSGAYSYGDNKSSGLSVRCVKD